MSTNKHAAVLRTLRDETVDCSDEFQARCDLLCTPEQIAALTHFINLADALEGDADGQRIAKALRTGIADSIREYYGDKDACAACIEELACLEAGAAAILANAVLRQRVKGLREALDAQDRDHHDWSDRPCNTCKEAGELLGRPYGCYAYQKRKADRRTAFKEHGE